MHAGKSLWRTCFVCEQIILHTFCYVHEGNGQHLFPWETLKENPGSE